jgi:ketosteroid isomerase-like protein
METRLDQAEMILKETYKHFNNRNIDATLAAVHPEVDWPNVMEGGREHGHEAVRNYWTRQWTRFDPRVEPIQFKETEDGRVDVTVHQIVHDVQGKLLVDQLVHHLYTIENGLITSMQIENSD